MYFVRLVRMLLYWFIKLWTCAITSKEEQRSHEVFGFGAQTPVSYLTVWSVAVSPHHTVTVVVWFYCCPVCLWLRRLARDRFRGSSQDRLQVMDEGNLEPGHHLPSQRYNPGKKLISSAFILQHEMKWNKNSCKNWTWRRFDWNTSRSLRRETSCNLS